MQTQFEGNFEFLLLLVNIANTEHNFFKLLRSPGFHEIDFQKSIPPAYVAWRAGTLTLFLILGYLAGLLCQMKSLAKKVYKIHFPARVVVPVMEACVCTG